MNVILEGPDGGGKSTLAAHLVGALGLRLQQGSGPPKTSAEIVARAEKYLAMTDTIFDRHPIISQPIYGSMRGDAPSITHDQVYRFYQCPQVLVYCRSTTVARHVVKPGEDPEHVQALNVNYARLVAAYDSWALEHAHVIYRIGDDLDQLTDVLRVIAG